MRGRIVCDVTEASARESAATVAGALRNRVELTRYAVRRGLIQP